MKKTKRQLKLAKRPNAAVLHSRRNGDAYMVAGQEYIGAPKVTDLESGRIVQKGVPFVRA